MTCAPVSDVTIIFPLPSNWRVDQTPLLDELALPLAMTVLVPAPVIRLFRRKFAGMICPGLAAGERFGDGQHTRGPRTSYLSE